LKNHNFKITTAKLAQICNVSQGTVDRALNNRKGISEKTKNEILKVAREYGYLEDAFSKEYLGTIGIIVFDVYNGYFAELIMYLEEACRKAGLSPVVMFSRKDLREERACIERLYFMGVKGIVLCPINKGPDFAAYLSSLKIPVICTGNRVEGIAHAGIDDFQAMADVARLVIEKGYEQLIYYAPVLEKLEGVNGYSQERRYAGFLEAVKAAGRDIETLTCTQLHQVEAAVKSKKRTAVIAPSDVYALQVRLALGKGGYGLIGFDNTDLTDYDRMQLDTVECHTADTAKRVIEYILNPEKSYFESTKHEIIHRGSLPGR